MFDTFGGDGGRPVNTCLIVIVNDSWSSDILKAHILATMTDAKKVGNTFIGGNNFSFT